MGFILKAAGIETASDWVWRPQWIRQLNAGAQETLVASEERGWGLGDQSLLVRAQSIFCANEFCLELFL